MGLDQYAYSAAKAGQYREYWDNSNFDEETRQFTNHKVTQPKELAYWRKHPNLQGWMEQLWIEKGHPGADDSTTSFNNLELELTREDIDRLEAAVTEGRLPATTGFFFGNNSDDDYRENDLQFIREARADLFLGLRVFYNSSW